MRASRARTLLLVSLLIGFAGCSAYAPHNVLPSPPSEEVRRQLGRIWMDVSVITPNDRSTDTLLKRLNREQRVPLPPCGQSIICLGVVLVAQGVALAVNTLADEKTADTAQEEAAIERAFGQPLIQRTLPDDIVRTARDSAGQLVQTFDSTAQQADTILTIDNVERGLIGGTRLGEIPQTKGLIYYMTARVRLIQQATKKELYAGQIEHLGSTMPLADWGANDAQRLREEFELASHELAEKVVDTLFLLYRFIGPDLP